MINVISTVCCRSQGLSEDDRLLLACIAWLSINWMTLSQYWWDCVWSRCNPSVAVLCSPAWNSFVQGVAAIDNILTIEPQKSPNLCEAEKLAYHTTGLHYRWNAVLLFPAHQNQSLRADVSWRSFFFRTQCSAGWHTTQYTILESQRWSTKSPWHKSMIPSFRYGNGWRCLNAQCGIGGLISKHSLVDSQHQLRLSLAYLLIVPKSKPLFLVCPYFQHVVKSHPLI